MMGEQLTWQPLFDFSKRLGKPLSTLQAERFLAYAKLLQHWNRVVNLVSCSQIDTLILKHFMDSISIINYIQETTLVDVGSGAGFPGIPISIINPSIQVTLLEPLVKRSVFLTQVVSELKLSNVQVCCARAQTCSLSAKFPAAVSRAFSSLSFFLETTAPLVCAGGRFYAMKGKLFEQELSAVAPHWSLEQRVELHYSTQVGSRHLLVFKHSIK